jgi:serine/threonine protein kinase
MELWNEYEGSTIAGTFRLERLLRPEGRSAFFSTTIGDGKDTVLRLIEAHYDDDEILARWKAVAGLKQEHLLGLTKFGHVVMDDTSLVYVVMEPTDADLGQILRERALSVTETRQLAESLVAALAALHSIGLVHEHIQPINVLAVDETVKLRSDCVREAPEGEEGDRARSRDIHDLSLLLLQALTLERNPDRVHSGAVPPPFFEILSNGLSDRWSLAQIGLALADSAPAPTPVPAPAASFIPPSVAPVARTGTETPQTATAAASTRMSSNPPLTRSSNGTAARESSGAVRAATETSSSYRNDIDRVLVEPGRTTGRLSEPEGRAPSALFRVALVAAALLGLILLLWHLTHRHPAAHTARAEQPMQTLANMPKSSAATPILVSRPQPTSRQPAHVPPRGANANANGNWRVIAFTYNESSQAQAKADHLGQQNPSLHFEVFSPRGHSPYLVAVNGFMTREDAFALRNKLRGNGLPRDIYAQNYTARAH